ncbi:MAG: cyclic nucleotide-binding domain-containing protein [bacterium]
MEIEALEGLKGTDLIQDTFLFQLLNFDETLSLAGLFRKEKRAKGETIIEEGELGRALYIIEQGKVKVIKGEAGFTEELATLDRGELFGEMSLIEDELTSASVVALTGVTLLVIDRQDFEKLVEENREIAFKVYKIFCHVLSERLRRTSRELSALKAERAATKKSGAKKPGAKKGSGSSGGKKPFKKTAKKK